MGRPLNSSNFGPEVGKLKIKFHNGTSVVTGYVTRQIGSTRYEATVDGSALFIVDLAQSTALASSLTAGFATFEAVATVGGGTVYLKNLQSVSALTTEGATVLWKNGVDVTVGTVAPAPTPTATIVVTTPAAQTAATPFTLAGTFTGTAPTKLRVKINAGAFTVVTTPTIGSGTYSFSVTVPSAGATTITVQDFSGDVAGVQGVSASFTVA